MNSSKNMKLKIHFGKTTRFTVPNKKFRRQRISGSRLNWIDILKLATSEPIKSGHHSE